MEQPVETFTTIVTFIISQVLILGAIYQYLLKPLLEKASCHDSLLTNLSSTLNQILGEKNEDFYKRILLQQTQVKSDILETLLHTLKHQHELAATNHKNLSDIVHNRLHDISKEVTQKLHTSFEKNNEVFHNVIKRLTLIDQAQDKITSLSENVVALQDILTDKSSRGAFGEVQLEQLIANVIPEQHYRLQESLPNGKRVDCLLLMPEEAGHICIDAKLTLENYQKQ